MRKRRRETIIVIFQNQIFLYVNVTDEEIEAVRKNLPVSADTRRKEYIRCGISPLNADKIIQNRTISDFFIRCF